MPSASGRIRLVSTSWCSRLERSSLPRANSSIASTVSPSPCEPWAARAWALASSSRSAAGSASCRLDSRSSRVAGLPAALSAAPSAARARRPAAGAGGSAPGPRPPGPSTGSGSRPSPAPPGRGRSDPVREPAGSAARRPLLPGLAARSLGYASDVCAIRDSLASPDRNSETEPPPRWAGRTLPAALAAPRPDLP